MLWEHQEGENIKTQEFCKDWGDRKASGPAQMPGKGNRSGTEVPMTRRQQKTTD